MNASVLRQIWSALDLVSLRSLLSLSDADLVQSLFDQVVYKHYLTQEEAQIVRTYLHSKTALIRDLA
jgi:hypothetical protein